ncbi:hypothetical protein [Aestuariicoccus sp. MJ-SS9]|uniref:hypothetical protein n=1 Tax=Aestuariicoccus sp. MJ-SS9 TaxID=3079855 RepID=UPI00290BEC63|nr:hypothetical protein [Aestuariicoccus sp. MJ-SS9]MDU8912795.1 hypothetical protein [Aestuariicoccus sp. MJ-SS9]
MTALSEYERLEATGLWRAGPDAQRRETIVSLGDATLTISEVSGRALTHWSLAALARANPGKFPALYHPDGDPSETLELAEDEAEMIAAIERLRRAIDRRRPRPGKLRLVLGLATGAAIAAAAVLWLPDALVRHTVSVVPPVKRAEIGDALLGHITRMSGQPCDAETARVPLRHLALRVLGETRIDALVVLPSGVRSTAHLPGGHILLNRAVLEDPEDPDVAAGFILAEELRRRATDPLGDLLDHAGLLPSLRLLTTGQMPDAALRAYAEDLLLRDLEAVPIDRLLASFAATELRSSPYAYALDVTGESTLPLIEADPRAAEGSRQVISDADWVRLQGICGA